MDEFNATIMKAEQEGPGPARAAWNELKLFPSCTLSNKRDSKRRSKRLTGEDFGRRESAGSRQ